LYKGRLVRDDSVGSFQMPSFEEKKVPTEEDIFREAEEIQRRAYEEGYTAGEKAGRAEGEKQAEIIVQKIGFILSDLTEFQKNFVTTMEKQVVDLAFAIARKILRDEISARPELIVSMVREALKRLQKSGKITIRINPLVQEIFSKNRDRLTDIHEYIEFEVSSGVPLNAPTVVSETEESVTDLDSLIDNIREELKNASGD